ncbi:hypothetical protein [Roseibium album]|uniref:hypothetical protein n=1 Tax=Roseibium album TaxID=311410 RepID=UPI0018CA6D59|nr:hypothetical protein [Labrenzia sp. EL_195]
MKMFIATSLVLLALPASAGELIGGTNTYISEARTWKTGEYAGYYVYDSKGTTVWEKGPLPDGAVECHGAGFWTPKEILGDGICIFGTSPDRWTVAHELTPGSNLWNAQDKNPFHRQGVWHVVHGTGRYVGMTGEGTYVSNELSDGRKTTWFEGDVEFAN